MTIVRQSVLLLFGLIYTATSISEPIKNDCEVLLQSFANVSALFIHCAIRNARPVTVCEECVDPYFEVIKVCQDINNTETSGGGVCSVQLVNLDRLEVFSSGYSYMSELWSKARCDTCLVSGTKELTASVKQIMNASVVLQDCIKTHTNQTTSDTKLVCKECKTIYDSLNDIFDDMKTTLSGEPCMDVVDLVNTTRFEWSGKLQCCNDRKTPQTFLILSISGLITCAIAFYVVSFAVTPKGEHPIIREKRWREISSIVSTRKSSVRRRSSAVTN